MWNSSCQSARSRRCLRSGSLLQQPLALLLLPNLELLFTLIALATCRLHPYRLQLIFLMLALWPRFATRLRDRSWLRKPAFRAAHCPTSSSLRIRFSPIPRQLPSIWSAMVLSPRYFLVVQLSQRLRLSSSLQWHHHLSFPVSVQLKPQCLEPKLTLMHTWRLSKSLKRLAKCSMANCKARTGWMELLCPLQTSIFSLLSHLHSRSLSMLASEKLCQNSPNGSKRCQNYQLLLAVSVSSSPAWKLSNLSRSEAIKTIYNE